jgi:N4-gp56 family major capsid protein
MTAYNVPGNTSYGDISPRTAIYAQKEFLRRALPFLILEKFGQGRPVPSNSSKVTKFRRYEALDPTPNQLSEGVTPTAKKLVATDVTATLAQYGDLVTISDVVIDTHEDPVLNEAVTVLGEQAAQMIETVRFNVLVAGTNVQYAATADTARSDVNDPISTAMQRKATRTLKRQNAKQITSVIRSTPSYGTQNVQASFIGLVHPDLESDIRSMTGFVAAENYGSVTPYENEIGKVEDVRYITSTVFVPFSGDANKGGTVGAMIPNDTTAANAAVYPVLWLARDAYGIVPLKGMGAITPTVVNPKPSDSDPLGQRGHVGWKSMQTAVILNDAFMVRGECAATL